MSEVKAQDIVSGAMDRLREQEHMNQFAGWREAVRAANQLAPFVRPDTLGKPTMGGVPIKVVEKAAMAESRELAREMVVVACRGGYSIFRMRCTRCGFSSHAVALDDSDRGHERHLHAAMDSHQCGAGTSSEALQHSQREALERHDAFAAAEIGAMIADDTTGHVPLPPPKPPVRELVGPQSYPAGAFPARAMR